MQKNIEFQDKKLSFVEERDYVLKHDVEKLAEKSLRRCVKKYLSSFDLKEFYFSLHFFYIFSPTIRKVSAICDQLYKSVIPSHLQNTHHKNEPVVHKFGFIQDYVLVIFL